MDRGELADFLRSRRARVKPGDVGLPAGRQRRTPGLRREEVAQLAGMSVDYYIRLEQGRGPHPSAQVLEALARALRLPAAERSHLFHLAGTTPRPAAGPRRDVPAGILHLLDRLDDTPAMVLDAKYDILAWNPMMCAVLQVDFSTYPRPNVIRWLLESGEETARGHVRQIREIVADLRAAAARYPDDAGVHGLVAELSDRSALFAGLWAEHEVEVRRSTSKRVDHPLVGTFEVDLETLYVPDRDQRLVLYTTAPGTPSHEALALLKVIGMQELRTGG